MTVSYNFALVLTSFMVAVLASYTALHLASRVSVDRGRTASLLWLGGGALSMGTGIWSMHFIGMLGSSIGIPMVYDIGWTLLSLLIAVTVSGLALHLVSNETLNRSSLAIGGAVMGAGIVSMHYVGMGAMQIAPGIDFRPGLVTVSVMIAVIASYIALALFAALRSSVLKHPFIKRGVSAVVMAVAISGMHYTGMAAAQFAPDSICTSPGGADVSNAWLAGTIAVFTLLLLAIALIISLYDAHLISNAWVHNQKLVEVNERLRHESEQREQANQQIRQQAEHLEVLNSQLEANVLKRTHQLEASVRELEAFSYAVAHDLRGPLSTIGGFCGLLEAPDSGRLNDKGNHYLERIKGSAEKMGELIEALLALAHLSRVGLRHEDVNLSALAQAAIDDCRARDPDREVHTTVQPLMHSMGDTRLLRQVMVNLINNAWKFSSRRDEATIEIGMTPGQDGRPVFHVKDNGAGFDMAYVDKLFGFFERLHNPTEFEGTGIGLASVHRILVRHEGRIWAESAPDQGAAFYFTLWEP
ncbi:MAG: hypothetical protein EOO28_16535 [Comamonadaceae bacterium]|nr:MAG: hypothetical protein EOO28_16535 [Comamonadaceae bacterium]